MILITLKCVFVHRKRKHSTVCVLFSVYKWFKFVFKFVPLPESIINGEARQADENSKQGQLKYMLQRRLNPQTT